MAGQRGAGQNAGMIARQAAQQGAANQQNAAGQAAQLQAQQSLGALGQLGGIAGQQVSNQMNATQQKAQLGQGEQQNILGAIGAQNNANVANISNQNAANAGLQQANAKGQQGLMGNLMGGIGSAAQMIPGMGGGSGGGGALPGLGDNSGAGTDVLSDSGSGLTDLTGAVENVAAPGGMISKQGLVTPYAMGGATPGAGQNMEQQAQDQSAQMMAQAPKAEPTPSTGGGGSGIPGLGLIEGLAKNQAIQQIGGQIGDWFSGLGSSVGSLGSGIGGAITAAGPSAAAAGSEIAPYAAAVAAQGGDVASLPKGPRSHVGRHFNGSMVAPMGFAHGGAVPAMVSPGERYLPPSAVKEVANGKNPMKAGEKIPGKPKVKGAKNDYANDTVPKTLEEGGIVLPRSVTQSKNPHWAAHKFVSAIMAKNGKLGK